MDIRSNGDEIKELTDGASNLSTKHYIKNLRGRILLYALISGLFTLFVELILGLNIETIMSFFFGNVEGASSYTQSGRDDIFQTVFLVGTGILVFIAIFLALMENVVNYVKEITKGIRKIAKGDLAAVIEPKGNDELTYIATSLNDMTIKIGELMEKEREAERTKNELITSVAHDLRTPLTSIIGYMEFLSMDKRLDEVTRQKYIEVVYVKAKRLEKLIEDLFSFTKLNYGTIAMKIGSVDIVMLINQLLEDFYPSFENNHLEYELEAEESSIIIAGDGNLLARLFDNLINNAIKYGSHGKVIRVVIKREQNQVVIRVINYGYVIPKEDLDRIFHKFYRVEQSRSENTGGTGLGLAIVKNIVEMHRGDIKVESSLDGTTFEVRLNIAFDPEEKLKL